MSYLIHQRARERVLVIVPQSSSTGEVLAAGGLDVKDTNGVGKGSDSVALINGSDVEDDVTLVGRLIVGILGLGVVVLIDGV